ncbi:PLP-dependent aminotransferase family protein [Streptomyces silaceus]|uniref:aminotransferase-like domain-containing protein n=1 Tax=Streptomyces silaceus TaxID=545123 RepID=UPI0006EBBEE5|nr:PLP-dependent aminotransferase family protein [Streptomyces silaceus]
MAREDYRRVADEVAREIEDGVLSPGQQLPPQRLFARRRRIANSTAIRVYGELVRRGLVVGEVGRGTFVRAAEPHPGGAALTEGPAGPPAPAAVNLELNYPVVAGQSELMGRSLAPLLRPDVLTEATRTAAPAGTPQAREAAADVLARSGWRPEPERVLFAGNSRQAIAAALSSLAGPGGRVGVEEVTYPLVKAIAGQLGLRLVPVAVDGQGMLPDALAAAHRAASLSAVYVQPTLQNPLSVTAGEERRRQLVSVVDELGLPVVEDGTWGFLADDAPAPLAARLPERVVFVDSLSKRLAPGLTVGMLTAPPGHRDALERSLRSGAWTAAAFNLEAAVRWAADGTVTALVEAKRADAAVRHRIVRERLLDAGVRGRFRTDPRAYYCWWELPSPWRADTFVAAAAERGVAVTPGSAFAVGSTGSSGPAGSASGAGGHRAPDAVRIGLASPPPDVLGEALGVLAGIVART